jgi:hypothetical protein
MPNPNAARWLALRTWDSTLSAYCGLKSSQSTRLLRPYGEFCSASVETAVLGARIEVYVCVLA